MQEPRGECVQSQVRAQRTSWRVCSESGLCTKNLVESVFRVRSVNKEPRGECVQSQVRARSKGM